MDISLRWRANTLKQHRLSFKRSKRKHHIKLGHKPQNKLCHRIWLRFSSNSISEWKLLYKPTNEGATSCN